MSTFEDIIQEVLTSTEGISRDVNVYGAVGAGGINSSVTTIPSTGGVFADGAGFTTGLIEIEDELINEQAFSRTTGAFSSCIRGWRGTTAATHAAGALITDNPTYPRILVKRAINDAIRNVFPRLFAVKEYEFTVTNQFRFEIPAGALNVLNVSFETTSTGYWCNSEAWKFIPHDGGATGKAIEIADIPTGRTARVMYTAQPTPLVNNADVYNTVTGLDDWTRDIIVLGALWRLTSATDISNIGYTTAEQSSFHSQSPKYVGSDITKNLMQLYQARMSEAEERIQELYPAVKHRVW